jgi:hypothetical protein
MRYNRKIGRPHVTLSTMLPHELLAPDEPMTFEQYEGYIQPIRDRHERTQRLFGALFFIMLIAACASFYFEQLSHGLILGLVSVYFLVRVTESSLALDMLDTQRLALLVRRD